MNARRIAAALAVSVALPLVSAQGASAVTAKVTGSPKVLAFTSMGVSSPDENGTCRTAAMFLMHNMDNVTYPVLHLVNVKKNTITKYASVGIQSWSGNLVRYAATVGIVDCEVGDQWVWVMKSLLSTQHSKVVLNKTPFKVLSAETVTVTVPAIIK